jgi:hypothetical protein
MWRTRGAGAWACLAGTVLGAACGGNGAAPRPARMPTADTTLGAAMPESARASAPPSAVASTGQLAAMRPLPASAHLLTSQTSPIVEAEVRVLRDQAAWAATWRALQPEPAARPVPPAVDFAREMVVVVAVGERSSGGHAVRVDGVSDAPDGGGFVLHVTRTTPGEGCMTTMVITAPVDVVRMPRMEGPVRLEARDVAVAC